MNNKSKRLVLFLGGCITIRILLVILAMKINLKYLRYMGYITLIPAFGFAYIYLTNSRKRGIEVFNEKIWWNHLRPIHSFLYFLFSYYAINKRRFSWKILAIDVILGLVAFLLHHNLL